MTVFLYSIKNAENSKEYIGISPRPLKRFELARKGQHHNAELNKDARAGHTLTLSVLCANVEDSGS